MVHGDDNGLVLPPRVAPIQVMIVPVMQHKEGVLDKAYEIEKQLKADVYKRQAFYLVAGALGNDVTLLDLNLDSLQGDKATIDFLKQMNCEIVENDEGIKVVSHGLKATIVDASQCPDVIPVVSLALSLIHI